MVELSVALMWIAISTTSAIGLAALARAAAASEVETDLATSPGDGSFTHDGSYHLEARTLLPRSGR